MTDIITITLNPTLDLSSAADTVTAGPKLRLDAPVAEPGGGGINVARAVGTLGGRARAVAALGGWTGARIRTLIESHGVTLAGFDLAEESRQSLAVTERTSGEQFRFVMPGPQWSAAQVAELLDRLEDDVRRRGDGIVVVLSGSQPPGVPVAFPQELALRLPRARLLVDTSGLPLTHLVANPRADAMPALLRMDHAESESLAGRALAAPADSLDFAEELVARKVAGIVVLARGGEGSGLVSADTRLFCTPPRVPVVSKVGAGDSFVAGMALAMARGQPLEDALRLGTTAAAAAVMTAGTELCRSDDVARLLTACRMQDGA